MADIVPGAISPAQASRLEASIRRYEAEIDSITRANASLRASIRSNASPLRLSRGSDLSLSSSRYEDPGRRKRETLEEYVETLEGRLRAYEAAEDSNMHQTITRLREDNISLRNQVDSLLTRLRATSSDTSTWESSRLILEDTITRLRSELRTETEMNSKLRADYRTLELRYERISTDYSSVAKARTMDAGVYELQETVTRLRSELRTETEGYSKLKADYRGLEARYERLTTEYASLTKTRATDSSTNEDRIRSLEAEVRRYREENGELTERLKRVTREYKENEEDLKYRLDLLEARSAGRDKHSPQQEPGDAYRRSNNPQEERFRKRYDERHRRDLMDQEEDLNSRKGQEELPGQKQRPGEDYEDQRRLKERDSSPPKQHEGHSKPHKREKRPPSAKAYHSPSKDAAAKAGNESQARLSDPSPDRSQGDSLAKSSSAKALSRSQKLKEKVSPSRKTEEMIYSCEACKRIPSPERSRHSSAKERK